MKNERCIRELYNSNGMSEEVFCTNEYGFVVDSFSSQSRDSPASIKNEWYDIIERCKNSGEKLRKSEGARRLIYRGIPLSLKYRLWGMLTPKASGFDYSNLISKKSGYEHQIHVDVQRTFRRHFLFNREYGRGQCELFNILTAYSNYNPDVGYCQGMSSAAALLLMYFPEEEAFEMLVSIIKNNNLEALFDKKLSKVPRVQRIQDEVFRALIPEVYGHLLHQNIDIGVYAVGWYLTLFTRFDIKLVLRMWDFFLFFDFSVFIFFAAGILKFFARKILELQGEQLIEFIGTLDSREVDVERVVSYVVESFRNGEYEYYRDRV
ncbi:Rab-GTPase-TBC domain-containing protein [Encephalitozoon hellem]|nr:Rab-GTPase-TBC domain-containing protein [Encephalitozoon hellem]